MPSGLWGRTKLTILYNERIVFKGGVFSAWGLIYRGKISVTFFSQNAQLF
jgi:hypothetical protein